MDRPRLIRRPLQLLHLIEGIAEPHKADRLTNAIRRLRDKVVPPKRDLERTEYNRKERDRYHSRVPTKARKMRPGQEGTSEKRLAPEKRLGKRLRKR
jgi:hypothetical protein